MNKGKKFFNCLEAISLILILMVIITGFWLNIEFHTSILDIIIGLIICFIMIITSAFSKDKRLKIMVYSSVILSLFIAMRVLLQITN